MILVFLLQGFGLGFAAAAQPGPFQAYLISRTLENGWQRTLLVTLAPLLSDGPIIALALLALSRVPAWLEPLLSLLGGLFVLYLASGAYRGWRDFELPRRGPAAGAVAGAEGEANNHARQSPARGLGSAVLMNALSPGPYLIWSLVGGPLLAAGWRQRPTLGAAFLGGFYAAMLLALAAIILVFDRARRLGPRFNRALLGFSALGLAGFGLYNLWRGLDLLSS